MLFDRQAREIVEAELDKNETLLWLGRPNALQIARKAYPFLLFGLAWTAVAAFLTTPWIEGPMSHSSTSPPASTLGTGLTLLVFWIIALAALLVPISAYLSARATIYALTSERVFILRIGRRAQVFGRGDIELVVCREIKDASGDLTITLKGSGDRDEEAAATVKLVGIPRVRTVERLLISNSSPLGAPAQASWGVR